MDPSTNLDGRCNCLAARKDSRYLSALYDGALSQVGLRATQFSILHKLRAGGPLGVGELATVMAMDRTTLSTNLRPLERDGLLAIRPGEDDRRRKAISITAAGERVYRQALRVWQQVQDAFEQSYGEQRAAGLRRSLAAVLNTGFSPWDDAPAQP